MPISSKAAKLRANKMNVPSTNSYRQEPSTKIKLRLDNSQLKIAEPPEQPSVSEDISSHVKLAKREQPLPFDYKDSRFEEEPHMMPSYLDNVANYNKNIALLRDKLEPFRVQAHANRPTLSSTINSINALQIPVFVRIPNGEVFFGSNEKMEPQITHVSNFVNLNVKNEHMSTEKGGFHSFAPRRRRRGTGKALKSASNNLTHA